MKNRNELAKDLEKIAYRLKQGAIDPTTAAIKLRKLADEVKNLNAVERAHFEGKK